jgi:hypothetical protein
MRQLLLILFAVIALSVGATRCEAQQGLGRSTITCLDGDGDGYGVGPGCLGPDADDTDATVHSASDAISKYGSMNAFLVHLGYQSASSPVRVYCIDPAGNDSTGAPSDNVDTACMAPYATFNPGVYGLYYNYGNPAIILFRAGTWTANITVANVNGNTGTSSQSTYVMGYPGETAVIDYSAGVGSAVVAQSYPYITVTNLRIKGNGNGSGYSGGTYLVYPSTGPILTAGDKLTYCEISGGGGGASDSNVDAFNITNFVLQYNVIHDPNIAGQHNAYLGSHSGASSGVVMSDNIMYGVHTGGYPNMQFNGLCNNCKFERNLLYDQDQVCIALYNGVTNSVLRNNVCWNTGTTTSGNGSAYGLVMASGYTGQCQVTGQPSICPNDQTGNVIENNTFWSGSQDIVTGASIIQGPLIQISESDVAPCGTCGTTHSNTFRNNILLGSGSCGSGTAGCYPVVVYNAVAGTSHPSSYYLGTDVWTNNIFNTADSSTYILGVGVGAPSGYAPYNCASFASMALSSTGCSTAAPLLTNVSSSNWNNPGAFNFTPMASSPAIGAGVSAGMPSTDVWGNTRFNPPAQGAIEVPATPSVWVEQTGSTLGSVCPASTGSGGGAGAVYSNYDFSHLCVGVENAWNTAVLDTKRNWLWTWGGGHLNYAGNELYIYNLNNSPWTVTRMNNPADWGPAGMAGASNCVSVFGWGECATDGSPLSRHLWYGMVYMPVSDKIVAIGGGLAPNGNNSHDMWMLDPTLCTVGSCPAGAWSHAISAFLPSYGNNGDGMSCVYDPTRASSTIEVVVCRLTTGYMVMFTYTITSNSWAVTTTPGATMGALGFSTGPVIDPVTKKMYWIGGNYGNSTFYAYSIDISGPISGWAYTDITSTVSACGSWGTAMNVPYPGLVWNSITQQIVGYPNYGSAIYTFNPATTACSTIAGSGSAPLVSPAYTPSNGQGAIFGRFQWLPTVNQYFAVTDVAQNAFSLQIPRSIVMPVFTTTVLPNGSVLAAYSATINVTGSPAPICSFTTGTFPGVTLSTACVLSGTPTTPGLNTFTVGANNGDIATKSYTVNVTGSGPAFFKSGKVIRR